MNTTMHKLKYYFSCAIYVCHVMLCYVMLGYYLHCVSMQFIFPFKFFVMCFQTKEKDKGRKGSTGITLAKLTSLRLGKILS